MKEWHSEIPYDFSESCTDRVFTEATLFFDIETTGFSPAHTQLYLIGCASRKGDTLILDQFFAESPADELPVITSFLALLERFRVLLSFNGLGFDLPYLREKCRLLHISEHFSDFSFIDIYKTVSQLKFLLKLPDYKQKSVEAFLDIRRNDKYSGGELIEVYHEYVKHPSDHAGYLLKQHNYDDILGMPALLPILSYAELFRGGYRVASVTGNEYKDMYGAKRKELIFTLQNEAPLPRRVSCNNSVFYLSACGNTTQLRVPLYEGELKFFFPNPRDYYYLPTEDTAIHKSVASYVAREYRKQATASTCYTKKASIFVPQYGALMTPAFREKYKDSICYFELSEEFTESDILCRQYTEHVLFALSGKKKPA